LPPNSSNFEKSSEAINRGFSKQSLGYDEADHGNIILQDLRQQVYQHVEKFIRPNSYILELNAGTGIDALHFASRGHNVHATDLSDGMIAAIKKKTGSSVGGSRITCQQVAYEELNTVTGRSFDYAFSNFGGLNCTADLGKVTRHLRALLKPGGYATWVIMPPVSPWELLSVLKGRWRQAFRRLKKGGVVARVEGEYFRTYYHSLEEIRSAFGASFTFVKCEGLAALSPPPHRADFPLRHPGTYKSLRKLDQLLGRTFPFNRCADHIIVTFQRRAQ
jgi:ubiquinone/menaquinone biosynthesis C-methylase UbiE